MNTILEMQFILSLVQMRNSANYCLGDLRPSDQRTWLYLMLRAHGDVMSG